jgi:cyclopropane fatty-acyl-phospholipid synthase-like methyltransferase
MPNNGRKSTLGYWESNWEKADLTGSAYGGRNRPAERLNAVLHTKLSKSFEGLPTTQSTLLELGCGGSRFLPYLAKAFGFRIAGLDYSSTGCESARLLLDSEKIDGTIVQGDLFDPPSALIGQFDVVASFGLVEHFEDTAACLSACAMFLKPGGRIVTMVPNMAGLYGKLYRLYDRKIFDIHVPLRPKDLAIAHARAGLSVDACEPLLGLGGVFDPGRVETSLVWRSFRRAGFLVSSGYFALEARGIGIPPNAFTSPYILCTAHKGLGNA